MMYYSSSESSDNENMPISGSLDYSCLMLDSQSLGSHLQNLLEEKGSYKTLRTKQALSPRLKTKDCMQENATEKLFLQHNLMTSLPVELSCFVNLKVLNLSNNNLEYLDDFICKLVHLQTLVVKNNEITIAGVPKDLVQMKKLKEVNFSGNRLTMIPPQLYKLTTLKYLYLGNNEITEISSDIKLLKNLHALNLGGNQLTIVPDELGTLRHLGVLSLCDNKIRRLPRTISNLPSLQSLFLHQNNLCCLPVEIIKIKSLNEISLRDNPLVAKFVNCCAKELMYTAPSLLELAARVIKLQNIQFNDGEIPTILRTYLNSGQSCVNPRCKGMYFTSCVEHIKFVDFCGMYRVPLMHYLCSSRCSSATPAYSKSKSEMENEDDDPNATLKKVLLG